MGSFKAPTSRRHSLESESGFIGVPSGCRNTSPSSEGEVWQEIYTNNHVQAWRHLKARPKSGTAQPANTNKEFCIYHSAHKDYTYSDKWVERLVAAVADDAEFATIKAIKL